MICRSGAGVDIVANKFQGVRSVLAANPNQAFLARSDDDVNVLSLASEFTDEEAAQKIILTWLKTPFSGDEKKVRRLWKIGKLEQE